MPKETIREYPNSKKTATLDVKWGKDHFDTLQLRIERGNQFVFIDDDEQEYYSGLSFTLNDVNEIDRLIESLKRARKIVEANS